MLTAKQGLNWNTRDPQFWRSPYARAGFALEICDVAQVRWFQMHVGSRHGVQASIFQMAVVRKSVWLAKPYRSAIRPLGVVAFNWPRKNGFGSISSSCTGIPTELLPMFRSIHAMQHAELAYIGKATGNSMGSQTMCHCGISHTLDASATCRPHGQPRCWYRLGPSLQPRETSSSKLQGNGGEEPWACQSLLLYRLSHARAINLIKPVKGDFEASA